VNRCKWGDGAAQTVCERDIDRVYAQMDWLQGQTIWLLPQQKNNPLSGIKDAKPTNDRS